MTTPISFSTAIVGSEKPGHGTIRRSIYSNPTGSWTELIHPTCETFYHNFIQNTRNHPSAPCLGWRPKDEHGVALPYRWLKYAEVETKIHDLASGLAFLGLIPKLGEHRMLGIYMANSVDWFIGDLAAYALNAVTVSFYDSLGAESTEFILNQTELVTVLCTSVELKKLLQIKARCSHIKNVILSGKIDNAVVDQAQSVGMHVYPMEQVEEVGAKHPQDPEPSTSKSLATIMYTSGTTGDPKGAMLSHSAMMCNATAVVKHLDGESGNIFCAGSTYLSYLPLAHIFERVSQICVIMRGGSIGFSQGDPLKIVEDLVALRPTIFCSVPRLLNRVYEKVVFGAKQGPKVKAFLFSIALNHKLQRLRLSGKLKHPIWDAIIFKRLQKKLGLDKCKLMVSGSAPLSSDVMEFFRISTRALVVEGYGQTESSSAMSLCDRNDLSIGHVGGVLPCCEIKLVSISEMGYEVTDTSHGDQRVPCAGRGEICVRGPSLFSGYFKLPDKTAEALDNDGWLHTGDIGIWTPHGQLRIVDRKKNIFKLSQGEYVAPEKIETVLTGSPLIAQIFVTGDSFHSHLVAIVVPQEDVFMKLAAECGLFGSFEELCANSEMRVLMQADMDKLAVKAKLSGFEKVRQIHLHPKLFTVEEGLLTPTLKLRRVDAKRVFKDEIHRLYGLSGDNIAGKNIKQN